MRDALRIWGTLLSVYLMICVLKVGHLINDYLEGYNMNSRKEKKTWVHALLMSLIIKYPSMSAAGCKKVL